MKSHSAPLTDIPWQCLLISNTIQRFLTCPAWTFCLQPMTQKRFWALVTLPTTVCGKDEILHLEADSLWKHQCFKPGSTKPGCEQMLKALLGDEMMAVPVIGLGQASPAWLWASVPDEASWVWIWAPWASPGPAALAAPPQGSKVDFWYPQAASVVNFHSLFPNCSPPVPPPTPSPSRAHPPLCRLSSGTSGAPRKTGEFW